MELDNESWLLEIGGAVIEKKAASDYFSLNEIEKAIYCLWVIDYAVRNSGALGVVEDIYPEALTELAEYANFYDWISVASLLSNSANEVEFCSKYYEQFDSACSAIKAQYANT